VSNTRATAKRPEDDSQAWRVVDDIARPHCIDPAELDAVEAFLMSQLNAILAADTKNVQKSRRPRASTRKRRNILR
jgi:hypothetical protein